MLPSHFLKELEKKALDINQSITPEWIWKGIDEAVKNEMEKKRKMSISNLVNNTDENKSDYQRLVEQRYNTGNKYYTLGNEKLWSELPWKSESKADQAKRAKWAADEVEKKLKTEIDNLTAGKNVNPEYLNIQVNHVLNGYNINANSEGYYKRPSLNSLERAIGEDIFKNRDSKNYGNGNSIYNMKAQDLVNKLRENNN